MVKYIFRKELWEKISKKDIAYNPWVNDADGHEANYDNGFFRTNNGYFVERQWCEKIDDEEKINKKHKTIKENKNEKFHITIKNNENGNIELDIDTNCIIGAVNEGDSTRALGMIKCNGKDLLATIMGVEEVLNHQYEGHPELKLFKELVGKIKDFKK